jgi:hypothetical protein
MIYYVSRFGYYTMNSGKIQPGWQGHYVGANSAEEAMKKSLPILNTHEGFLATDSAEVMIAKCRHHPRYQIQRVPTGNCGVCHAMWQASKNWVAENESE